MCAGPREWTLKVLVLDGGNRNEGRSGLLNTLGATSLTLDLLASPACSFDGSGLEVTILASFLNHSGEPFSPVICRKFAVGEGISKIPGHVSGVQVKVEGFNYPMTPIDDLISASLLFWSRQTTLRREKIVSTYG